MGFGAFDRPVGAAADVSELQYVSALMQTDVEELRTDGTIQPQDIALFLQSRYGLDITPEQVAERLLTDFTTAKKAPQSPIRRRNLSAAQEQQLDLMEFTALLLISKLRRSETDGSCECLYRHAMKIMQEDGLGLQAPDDDDSDAIFLSLTPSVLKRILGRLGEFDLAADNRLLVDMCNVVKEEQTDDNGRALLNATTLQKALVHDVQKFESTDDILTNFAKVQALNEEQDPGFAKEVLETAVHTAKQVKAKIIGGEGEDNNNNNNNNNSTHEEAQDSMVAFEEEVVPQTAAPTIIRAMRALPLTKTAPFIDWTADTYRSQLLVVLLWAFFGLSFLTYGILSFPLESTCEGFEERRSWIRNFGAFVCSIGWSVGRWLYTLVLMSIYGLVFFVVVGRGNGIETTKPNLAILGALAAALFVIIPPAAFPDAERNEEIIAILSIITVIVGCLVFLFNVWNAVSIGWPHLLGEKYKSFLVASAIRGESLVRQSGRKKMDNMVDHALDMHQRDEDDDDALAAVQSHLGRALFTYANRENTVMERVGGFRWTWTRIWNNELFSVEGLWFSGRLVSINVSQFLVAFLTLAIGCVGIYLVRTEFDTEVARLESKFINVLFDLAPDIANGDEILLSVSKTTSDFILGTVDFDECVCPDVEDCSSPEACQANTPECTVACYTNNSVDPNPLFQQAILVFLGYAVENVRGIALAALAVAARESVESIYPNEMHMVIVPVVLATLVAFVVAIVVSLAVIPGAVSATLKLRCGVIPLMHNPKHKAIRIAPDQTISLRGALLWGTLLSASLMALIIAAIAFFLLWQVSAYVAQRVVAFILGLLVIVLMHWILVRKLRKLTSMAFYRNKVRAYNVVVHARECAQLALSVGFTLVRMGKLLVTTILFLGRLDRPFLASGVGEIEEIGFKLDNHPHIFLMELLQHEAHRHPYIEMFGAVCLLKLRTGDAFVSRAGSAWRLLLLLMLMPWLTRYRRLARAASDNDGKTVLELSHAYAQMSIFDLAQYQREHSGGEDETEWENKVEQLEDENRRLKEQVAILMAEKKKPGPPAKKWPSPSVVLSLAKKQQDP